MIRHHQPGTPPSERTRIDIPLVLGVVGAFLDRDVCDDPTNAPGSIVFGGVGIVG